MIKLSWLHLKWIFSLYLLFSLDATLEAGSLKRARVEISGPVDSELEEQLVKSTSIPTLPPLQKTWQRNQLLKAIQEEVPRWLQVLHGFGFYDAQIRTRLRQTAYNWVIELQISPGPCYAIEKIVFEEYTSKGIVEATLPIDFKEHLPASAAKIAQMEKEVLNYYRNSGYASAQITHKQIEIHPSHKTVKLKWLLNRGGYYLFGKLDRLGLKRVNPNVIDKKILFREGTPYNQELVDLSQAMIDSSGQFTQVHMAANWSQEKAGKLPMLLSVSEAKRRSIAFGVNFATDSGMGSKFLWENRNLTGNADLLAFRSLYSKRQKKAYWVYNRPDIFSNQTDLRWQVELNDENTRAYNENNLETGFFLDRKLHKRLKFSYGPNLQFLKTTKTDDNSYKALLSLVTSLNWTNIENPLKPIRGRFHQIQLTPFSTLEKNSTTFLKVILKNGFFYPIRDPLTLGLGFQAGSILGASRRDIPPPLRFFEGGANSFRGYTYKTVSPLSDSNTPIGGRSFLLFTLEPRLQITKDFSVIPFYETGKVYTRGHPEPLQGYLQSAGLGLSWDTIVGPVRFDIAFALNKRETIDSFFQLYLSIGSSL